MNGSWSRRGFAALGLTPCLLGQDIPRAARVDKGPPLEDSLVKEFVGAAHGNLDRTRELLTASPGLINATWDWGGGDFETALGGASHMGNREIALFLLGRGARMDLFAAAMLGNLEIVKAAVSSIAGIQNVRGPHGITLLAHAKRGGVEAQAVAEFLKSLPA